MSILLSLLILVSFIFLGLEWMYPCLILFAGTLMGMGVIAMGTGESERRFVMETCFAALLLRICLILPFFILSYTGEGFHPGSYFATDGYAYSQNGWQIAQAWQKGVAIDSKLLFTTLTGSAPGAYEYWNAFIYSFTGGSPLPLFFINSLIGVASSLAVFFFTKKFFGIKSAKIALLLSAFCPSLVFWSTQNLKDPVINLVIFTLIWSVIEIHRRPNFWFILVGLCSSFVLMKLRSQVFILIFLIVPIWLVTRTFLYKKMKPILLILVISVGAFKGIQIQETLRHTMEQKTMENAPKIFSRDTGSFVEWAHYLREVRATGGSAFLKGFDLRSPKKFILFLPLTVIYCLFAPFPWQGGGGLFSFLAVFEMSLLYLFFPYIVRGIRYALKSQRDQTDLILLTFFCISLLLVIIESNVGTLFRHRSMILYFILIFLAVGLSESKKIGIPEEPGAPQ